MNPSTDQPLLPPPLQLIPPPQPHRSSFSCDRHPSEQYTGFCPTCLCERLTTLDHSSASSSSRRPSNATANSSTAAALKAIFRIPGASSSSAAAQETTGNGIGGIIRGRNKASASSFLPELRRTKSFSASKNEGFSGVFEPQRRSCDVRGRSTLWNLFNQDDVRKSTSKNDQIVDGTAAGSVNGPVLESKEEENDDNSDDGSEIRVLEETNVINVVVVQQPEPEPILVEEEEKEDEIVSIDQEEIKTMKDHIDLDSQAKKPSGMDLKEIAGTVWAAASVFSKKWNKWRHKQKLKKHNADVSSVALPVEKPISRQFHETQSEIADYGFGRRSCDTDPRFSLDAGRFSLDAGRMSFEDPRYSFDEPRASWDGYLIGRTFPRLPPILSVVEDPPAVHISRSDSQIPVEEEEEEEAMTSINESEAETVPGGTAQTRDYYCDSTTSSRRRKSLDRSSSIRKTAAAVVAEIDEIEMKTTASNAKVSPTTMDYIPGSNNRDSNSNSSETFELGFNGEQQHQQQKGLKKSRRWMKSWNIWGFIHRKNNNNNNHNNNKEEFNGVQRSFSETWPDQRGFNRRVLRSNSSVSSRNSYNMGLFGSMRKQQQNQGSSSSSVFESNLNSNGHGKKKKEEFVLERNRSARYSPNDAADNGLLRFYLTPMRSSSGRRGPSKLNNSHSIVRNVLRLY